MTNGEWRMANDEWRMVNGEWRMWTLDSTFSIQHSTFSIDYWAPTSPGRIGGASGIRSKPTSFQAPAVRVKYAWTGRAHDGCAPLTAAISTRTNAPSAD